jgi:hypothetical protein
VELRRQRVALLHAEGRFAAPAALFEPLPLSADGELAPDVVTCLAWGAARGSEDLLLVACQSSCLYLLDRRAAVKGLSAGLGGRLRGQLAASAPVAARFVRRAPRALPMFPNTPRTAREQQPTSVCALRPPHRTGCVQRQWEMDAPWAAEQLVAAAFGPRCASMFLLTAARNVYWVQLGGAGSGSVGDGGHGDGGVAVGGAAGREPFVTQSVKVGAAVCGMGIFICICMIAQQ